MTDIKSGLKFKKGDYVLVRDIINGMQYHVIVQTLSDIPYNVETVIWVEVRMIYSTYDPDCIGEVREVSICWDEIDALERPSPVEELLLRM